MNKTEIEKFIEENRKKQIPEVVLKLSKVDSYTREFIVNQIHGKQKAKSKYPFLLDIKGFKFPSPRAISQSSSQQTASNKSRFVTSGGKIADLSGGMGLDSYYFSKVADHVDYVEVDAELAALSKNNFEALNAKNIYTHNTDAKNFLENSNEKYDLVFIDPDRRLSKEKAFKIEDCEPNVAKLLPLIWEKSEQCLIKLSPMLDITQALEELNNCIEVHVVSVENECKELLFLLAKDTTKEPAIITTNLTKHNEESYTFHQSKEKERLAEFSKPQHYIYEPNSSILKSGAFKSIAYSFGLQKLAVNTHLYTSEKLADNFPGRKIEIIEVFKPKKGKIGKANVVCRNFPLSTDQLKKKYKIKDGGEYFLYACSLNDNSKVFIIGKQVIPYAKLDSTQHTIH